MDLITQDFPTDMEGIEEKGTAMEQEEETQQLFKPLDQVYSRYINDLQVDGVVCYAIVSKEQLEFMLYQNMLEFESSFSVKPTLAEECLIYSNHDQHIATQNLCRVNNNTSISTSAPQIQHHLDGISKTLICSICQYEIDEDQEVQSFVPCQHKVHASCCVKLTKYCLKEMWSQARAVCIECPECKAQKRLGFLTEGQVGNLLGWESEEFEKFQKNRQQVLPKDMMYCPNPSCEQMIALLKCPNSTGRTVYSVECECGKRFCSRCSQEEHWPLTCGEFILFKGMEDSLMQDELLQAQMQLMYGMNTRMEGGLQPPLLPDLLDTRFANVDTPHQQLLNRYFELIGQQVPENLRQLVNPRQVRDIGAIRELLMMERMHRGVLGRGGMAEAGFLRRMELEFRMEDEEDLLMLEMLQNRRPNAQQQNNNTTPPPSHNIAHAAFNVATLIPAQVSPNTPPSISVQESNPFIPLQASPFITALGSNSSRGSMDEEKDAVVGADSACNQTRHNLRAVSSDKQSDLRASQQHDQMTTRFTREKYGNLRHNLRSDNAGRSKLQNRVKTTRMPWSSMFNFGSSKQQLQEVRERRGGGGGSSNSSSNIANMLPIETQEHENKNSKTQITASHSISKITPPSPFVYQDPQSSNSSQLSNSVLKQSTFFPLDPFALDAVHLFPNFEPFSKIKDFNLSSSDRDKKDNKGVFQASSSMGGIIFKESQSKSLEEKISSRNVKDDVDEDMISSQQLEDQVQGGSQDENIDSSLSEAAAAAASTSSSAANLAVDKGDATGGSEGGAAEESIAQICKDCPNCFVPIYLFSGCNHVLCSKCGHQFCYQCRKPWQSHGYALCQGESKDLPTKDLLEQQWQQFAKKYDAKKEQFKKEEWMEERLRREREMREKFTDTRWRFGNLLEMREPEEHIQERRERREQQLQFLNQLSQQVQLRKIFVMQTALFQQSKLLNLRPEQIQVEYQNIQQARILYKTVQDFAKIISDSYKSTIQYCNLVQDCCKLLFNFRILLFLLKTGVLSGSSDVSNFGGTSYEVQILDPTFQLAMFQIEALEQHTQKAVTEIQHWQQLTQQQNSNQSSMSKLSQEQLEEEFKPVNEFYCKIPDRCYALNGYLRNFVERMIQWDFFGNHSQNVNQADQSQNYHLLQTCSISKSSEVNNSRRFKALLNDDKSSLDEIILPMPPDSASDDGLLSEQI